MLDLLSANGCGRVCLANTGDSYDSRVSPVWTVDTTCYIVMARFCFLKTAVIMLRSGITSNVPGKRA